jgi:hypothetical protein
VIARSPFLCALLPPSLTRPLVVVVLLLLVSFGNLFGISRRYSFSNADTKKFSTLKSAPDGTKHPHAFRWYMHVAALTGLGSF